MNTESKILREKVNHLSDSPQAFNALALEIFRYQQKNNETYSAFLHYSGKADVQPESWQEIPCLPVSLFKTHDVRTGNWKPIHHFSSSGTTGSSVSLHPVKDPEFYLNHTKILFEKEYGALNEWVILALLPGYLERTGSSLVAMADFFINNAQKESGFFLDQHQALFNLLNQLKLSEKKTLLLGVTHALLDFAERFPMHFPSLTIMETGGMKGRKKEMLRSEVHEQLKTAFDVELIHSEYGMTELFSQAYSKGEGIFHSPNSMRVLSREVTDPYSITPFGKSGAFNIYDLANTDTIAFIAIDDLGKCHDEKTFEVVGRVDNCDIRGCNLMIS